MVVGDREVQNIEHFSPAKKALQRLGSWVVRQASQTSVPDTTSGFRAYNREAALAMQVVSKFTYTLETIIQAGKMTVAIDHVPIRTNPKLRESRLFPSMWTYVRRNGRLDLPHLRDVRAAAGVHDRRDARRPRRAVVWGRFFYFWFQGDGGGHVQSLILGAVLFNAAMVLAALGVIGDLLSSQRITLQRIFERVRRVELELGVPPSHYEPGAPAAGAGAHHRRPRRAARHDGRARDGAHVSSAVTRDAEGTVTGNTYDKYGSTNPVVQRLMAGFERSLDELFAQAAPPSLLDVGCGEGVLTHKWAQRLGAGAGRRHRPRGPGSCRREWAAAPRAEPRVPGDEGREPAVRRRRVRRRDGDRGARARPRPRAHGRRDGARRAAGTCSSPSRASRSGAALNMARGAYVRDLGNTPGPREPLVQARVRGAALAPRRGRRGALAVPVDDAARPPLSGVAAADTNTAAEREDATRLLRPRRADPVGRDRHHRARHVRVLLAGLARAERGRLQGHHAAVVGDVPDHLDHLPAGRAAAVADDLRRGGRAGWRRPSAAAGDAIQAASRVLFLVVALAFREPIEDDVFDGSAALYWVLVVRRARLRGAATSRAAGWPGHSRFGLYGGLVLLESCSRCLFALAVVIGIASGPDARWRWASRPRRSSRSWSCRGRCAARDPAPPAEAPDGAAGWAARERRFAGAVLVIMARRADAAERRRC